ncbi:MAG: hypothetical protein FJ096_16730 [Deltaproteobacteria bacterium]|nr:hypothetical protein [Deltaproteobacteria bacterium]
MMSPPTAFSPPSSRGVATGTPVAVTGSPGAAGGGEVGALASSTAAEVASF